MSRPPLGRIAFMGIPWYSVIVLIGFMAGGYIAIQEEKRLDFPRDTAIDFMLLTVPLSIIGARLYYVAFQWDYYRRDLSRILNIREGGLAIYGGVIMGFVAALIIARRRKIPLPRMLDALAPALALGQAIGRWGNYANMEAFGREIVNPSLRFFPYGVEIWLDGAWHWRQAAFFYESAACLAIFLFLWIRRKHIRPQGAAFLWYVLLYGMERAFVEGLREDSLMLGNVRVSQALSIAAAIAALVALVILYMKNNARLHDDGNGEGGGGAVMDSMEGGSGTHERA